MGAPRYRCIDCGIALNDGEGKVFTVCSPCWDKNHRPPQPSPAPCKDCGQPLGHLVTCMGWNASRVATWSERIRQRITEKRALYEHYRQHASKMLGIEDAHGAWDSAVNMSEVSCALDELSWVLAIIEGRES